MALFSRTIHLGMKGQLKFSSDTIKTALFFSKLPVRDNRGRSNFEVTSTKMLYIWEMFTWYNRGSAIFQVPSSKLPYVCKKFNL